MARARKPTSYLSSFLSFPVAHWWPEMCCRTPRIFPFATMSQEWGFVWNHPIIWFKRKCCKSYLFFCLRDCPTEWSKSEREKQISYINAYMWNLKKKNGTDGHSWKAEIETQMQRTNVWTPRGGREGRMNWKIGIDIYMLQYIKQITDENLLHSTGSCN